MVARLYLGNPLFTSYQRLDLGRVAGGWASVALCGLSVLPVRLYSLTSLCIKQQTENLGTNYWNGFLNRKNKNFKQSHLVFFSFSKSKTEILLQKQRNVVEKENIFALQD